MAQLTGPAKLAAVQKILDDLAKDLESPVLKPQERDVALEQLKLYGRNPSYAEPIFTKRGLEILTKFAFDSASDTTSRNALRVLCNTLFLQEQTRQVFVSLGYEAKACLKLRNDSWEDEFLISRLILLTTYGTNIDLPTLIENEQLADTIIQNLSRHAKRLAGTKPAPNTADPMAGMALEETLKLLFNVTNFAKDHLSAFDRAFPHISSLLSTLPPPQASAPLDPPFGLLINTLVNLDASTPTARAALFPVDKPTLLIDRLLQLLDLSLKTYNDTELEQSVTQLVCTFSLLYEHAPKPGSPAGADTDTEKDTARTVLQKTLLPTEQDRVTVLGRADTLPSRLLRNWTNPLTPNFGRAIAHLFFDLSDKSPVRFVENVGYGYASGFLFENNINVPEEALRAQGGSGQGSSSSAGGANAGRGRREVNPITGQFLDEERFADLPEMTMEEKEREAERLFVLFERLRQTGVVDVENPVATAMREGRIQELSDDDDAAEDLD
ncbi:guanine nucleotide exchange factor synembryn-like protein [Dichotomopilus funicola]|uniref:Guanine nucleotide exchange factor synembryn-like protein n=1 Tax=Dichotomopilus funicola TaxID=1934379 RepID=A0AAN6VD06_9PEZI|nr:guanine nucleotide exchange factor synembryn-like protein [Dichotomopilus funicola]